MASMVALALSLGQRLVQDAASCRAHVQASCTATSILSSLVQSCLSAVVPACTCEPLLGSWIKWLCAQAPQSFKDCGSVDVNGFRGLCNLFGRIRSA